MVVFKVEKLPLPPPWETFNIPDIEPFKLLFWISNASDVFNLGTPGAGWDIDLIDLSSESEQNSYSEGIQSFLSVKRSYEHPCGLYWNESFPSKNKNLRQELTDTLQGKIIAPI